MSKNHRTWKVLVPSLPTLGSAPSSSIVVVSVPRIRVGPIRPWARLNLKRRSCPPRPECSTGYEPSTRCETKSHVRKLLGSPKSSPEERNIGRYCQVPDSHSGQSTCQIPQYHPISSNHQPKRSKQPLVPGNINPLDLT